MMSGTGPRAASSSIDLTSSQRDGKRPSGRSCVLTSTGQPGKNWLAASCASVWRSGDPVRTMTWARTCRDEQSRSSVPPQPISMSSGCAPRASTLSGPWGIRSPSTLQPYRPPLATRVTICQVGVFLRYAAAGGRTLMDRELHVPQEWTQERKRCGGWGARRMRPARPHLCWLPT